MALAEGHVRGLTSKACPISSQAVGIVANFALCNAGLTRVTCSPARSKHQARNQSTACDLGRFACIHPLFRLLTNSRVSSNSFVKGDLTQGALLWAGPARASAHEHWSTSTRASFCRWPQWPARKRTRCVGQLSSKWPTVVEVKEIQLVSKKGMTQCKQRRCLIVLVSAQLRESFRGTLGVCRHGTKRLAAFAQSLTRNNNKCIP